MTTDALAGWLRTHDLEQYTALFAEHDVASAPSGSSPTKISGSWAFRSGRASGS
jgi:hypothetical protein